MAPKEKTILEEINELEPRMSNLLEILERLKKSTTVSNSITSSNLLKPPETVRGHRHSSSISSISSSCSTADCIPQEYYDESKQIFDRLKNILQGIKHLTEVKDLQRQFLFNTSFAEGDHVYYSLSSDETLSRQETIYYDASESNNIGSDEERDPSDKMSDSDDTSSYDEEENLLVCPRRASIAQHPTKLPNMRLGRSSLPHPALDIGNVGLWQILGRSIGKDLSRVTMPVILNEPLGILQRLCEEMEYAELLDDASKTDDEHLRLAYVSAFIVSTYSANYYRTGRKNFNPIQGETYEFIPKDKTWKFFSEQVSHHPAISVGHCQSANFQFTQKLQVKIKFWGKSMELIPDSMSVLFFPKYNERITWNKCTMCIHNVLSSSKWIDHYGDVEVTSSLGNVARISFIESNARTRSNKVAGDIEDSTGKVIHRIFGHWHDSIFLGNDQSARCIWRQSALPTNSKHFYGFTKFAMKLNELDSEVKDQLPPTDSRFRPDQRFLENGDIDSAEKSKTQIEEIQRARSKQEFISNWFRIDGSSYLPITNEEKTPLYWEKRNQNWNGVNFLSLW